MSAYSRKRTYALTDVIHPMLRFKLRERIADLEFKERRRVSIQEVAAATGLSRMTLSKLINEHGANVQTDALDRLCRYFGCRLEQLAEYVGDDSQSAQLGATSGKP